MPDGDPCACGSGQPKYALYDGHGIFLTYVCEKCKKDRLKGFRSDIMDNYACDEPIEEDY